MNWQLDLVLTKDSIFISQTYSQRSRDYLLHLVYLADLPSGLLRAAADVPREGTLFTPFPRDGWQGQWSAWQGADSSLGLVTSLCPAPYRRSWTTPAMEFHRFPTTGMRQKHRDSVVPLKRWHRNSLRISCCQWQQNISCILQKTEADHKRWRVLFPLSPLHPTGIVLLRPYANLNSIQDRELRYLTLTQVAHGRVTSTDLSVTRRTNVNEQEEQISPSQTPQCDKHKPSMQAD